MEVMRGIFLKLASVALFVAMASFVKAAAEEVPSFEAAFFRSLFAIPLVVSFLAFRGQLHRGVRVVSPWPHAVRGVLGSIGMLMGFTALSLLPLPDATALAYAAPILVVIFSAIFLGEPVRMFRITVVILGMVGVMIVLAPRLSLLEAAPSRAEQIGALAAIMGAIIAAGAQLYVRKMVQTESTTSVVFWFTISTTVVTAMTFPFGWVMPSGQTFAFLVMAGVCGGAGQVCLTFSYLFAKPSLLAPFDYASMVLAIITGYIVFDEVPTWNTLLGAAVIVGAGLTIIWRERQLGLAAERHRKAQNM